MKIEFYKYQGCGNDFIMIDDREDIFPKNDTKLVEHLCDRRFGIGGDGLILLENDNSSDFRMRYYNSDGNPSSMCGNGGRCIVAFAKQLGIIGETTTFMAVDGLHHASLNEHGVRLGMKDVTEIRQTPRYLFMDTGSPHHVQLIENLENHDVKQHGAMIRYGLYGLPGCNINFVEPRMDGKFDVRTYERGVEDETLACGTGVTAVALAMYTQGITQDKRITLNARGGILKVGFEPTKTGFREVYLEGPAEMVFKGQLEW